MNELDIMLLDCTNKPSTKLSLTVQWWRENSGYRTAYFAHLASTEYGLNDVGYSCLLATIDFKLTVSPRRPF